MSVVKRKENNQRHLKKSARVCGQLSSFLRGDHLQDEVDDGAGRLVRVHLSKEVADVVGCASLLTRHKPKQPGKIKTMVQFQ